MEEDRNNRKVPRHVAIIMDGNGRWAAQRGLPRSAGHKQGAEAVRRVIKAAAEMDIAYLTLFGFSSENWRRPQQEVSELLNLLRFYLRSETVELHKNNVRLKVIGDRSAFSKDIIRLIDNAEGLTKENTGITAIIALNYGGRHDIVQAAGAIMRQYRYSDALPDDETLERALGSALMTAEYPDPDLLIRTSGEQRISNFLLWQCAYAELVFLPTLWPDFGVKDLERALAEYAQRDRRFGALSSRKM